MSHMLVGWQILVFHRSTLSSLWLSIPTFLTVLLWVWLFSPLDFGVFNNLYTDHLYLLCKRAMGKTEICILILRQELIVDDTFLYCGKVEHGICQQNGQKVRKGKSLFKSFECNGMKQSSYCAAQFFI